MAISKTFTIGHILDPKRVMTRGQEEYLAAPPLTLLLEDLLVHGLVSGASGSGKSKIGILLARLAREQNIPYLFVDIHGDGAEDDAADVALAASLASPEQARKILKRYHYLEFSPTFAPRFDPFYATIPNVHPELVQNFRTAMAETLVDANATLLQSTTQGSESFEGMPRLLRNLKGALHGCATPAPVTRLPFSLVGILLNVQHPEHMKVYRQIAATLPTAVRADFDYLHSLKNPEKAREQQESALNRVSGFFSALLAEAFGSTSETAPVFDFESVVRKGESVVANLRATKAFSHLQGVTVARYLCTTFVETIMALPRDQRPPSFLLFVEEAGEILTDAFLRYLGAVRKYGINMIFLGQDASTFRKPNLDLIPKLLSQCGILLTFNQRFPDDAEVFARTLFQGSLDFEPLIQEVERDGEIEWLQVEETGESGQTSKTNTHGTGKSRGRTTSRQTAEAEADQLGWKEETSTTEVDTTSEVAGKTSTAGYSVGKTGAPVVAEGKVVGLKETEREQESKSLADMQQHSNSKAVGHGNSKGKSGSKTKTKTTGTGEGESEEASISDSVGDTVGSGWSVSKKWVHIARKIRELQETGQLRKGPTAEQMEQFKAMLMELPSRFAVMKKQGQPAVLFRTADVPEPFASKTAMGMAMDWLKKMLRTIHAYTFVPDLGPNREAERVAAFLTANGAPATPYATMPYSPTPPTRTPKPSATEPKANETKTKKTKTDNSPLGF